MSGPSSLSSASSYASRSVNLRFVPALRRLLFAFLVGNTTWVFDEDAVGAAMLFDGEVDRLRVVVGRDFPFLKNGTLTSEEAMVVMERIVTVAFNFVAG